MRLHLVGLPHTTTTEAHVGCAYTQKVVKFCRMMTARGHEIVLYATERNEAPVAEHVALLTEEERLRLYGADDPNRLPDWPDDFTLFNARALSALLERTEPHDFVLVTGGHPQAILATALPDRLVVEWAVGYEGIFAPYCAFESYAWMHRQYQWLGLDQGRYFDAVIPNYFDTEEFPEKAAPGGDYLLFVGRLIANKGIGTAADIARRAGLPLVVAGAGATSSGDGFVEFPEGRIEGEIHYCGPVGVAERGRLMAGALALLAPTTYIEPFGGVAVEAMMCGTPALTTDWGAFTETVEDGVTGYRFRTLREGVRAVERAASMDPELVRRTARGRYSLEAVAPKFERWFERLATLWGEGWYA